MDQAIWSILPFENAIKFLGDCKYSKRWNVQSMCERLLIILNTNSLSFQNLVLQFLRVSNFYVQTQKYLLSLSRQHKSYYHIKFMIHQLEIQSLSIASQLLKTNRLRNLFRLKSDLQVNLFWLGKFWWELLLSQLLILKEQHFQLFQQSISCCNLSNELLHIRLEEINLNNSLMLFSFMR